jgi:Zn-dependent peptidase ImmA (M78 family)
MRRGFKTRSEEMAATARASLGLHSHAKLCPFIYADRLGIPVIFPADTDLSADHVHQLTVADPDSWSGLTMREDDSYLIVMNPAHPRTRQVNTLMHELSHILLKHLPTRVDVSETGLLLLTDYDLEQEEEADWLAGAVLLPRVVLLALRARERSEAEIADMYGVSRELCAWRIRMTGVDAQVRARGSIRQQPNQRL